MAVDELELDILVDDSEDSLLAVLWLENDEDDEDALEVRLCAVDELDVDELELEVSS